MPADVSVIIPTFRRPDLLAEAVCSALAQDGVVVEVLVFDDSPEGSAEEAVRAIDDPRVAYHKRAAPSGGRPALVRNEGWPLSAGRYVAFLDDDDRVVPDGYRALVQALDAKPAAALAFGRVAPFGADGAQLSHELAFFLDAAHRARRAHWSNSRLHFASGLLFDGALFVTSATLVRRAHLEALGGLDPATDLIDSTDLGVRAARGQGCLFVDREVVEFRYDAGSLIHGPEAAERMRQAYRAMHASYRKRYGVLEFTALKIFARSFKRWL